MARSKILIVEDEQIIALDLRCYLEELGYEVVDTVSRGEDAIQTVNDKKPDLILMDIHLAGNMLGTEAALEISKQHRLPIIFLTAYSDQEYLTKAADSAPYGYLVKPYDGRELEATIQMAMVRFQAEQKIARSEQHLRLALEAAKMEAWEWDGDNREFKVIATNTSPPPPAMFGGSQDDLLNLVHISEHSKLKKRLCSQPTLNEIVRLKDINNTPRWAELHAQHFQSDSGNKRNIIGVIRDVTESQKLINELRQADAVFQATSEAIVITDKSRKIISVNPAFEAITGYHFDDAYHKDPDSFLHARRHSDQFYPHLMEAKDKRWSGEIACYRKDGKIFQSWQHVCLIYDDNSEIKNYVFTFSDITALRRAESDLAKLAYFDHLTGLGNRVHLEQKLKQELIKAQENTAQLAIFFIDLDGFKLVNDTLGHAVGDELLKVIAIRLQSQLRRYDTAIRLGGDEFVVITPELDGADKCDIIAGKLLQALGQEITIDGEVLNISASIGISIYPNHGFSFEDLIKAADTAMFAAKNQGRNCYVVFDTIMAEQAREHMVLEQALKKAVENGVNLDMHYQPVVNLLTGALVGVECLSRWNDHKLGQVSPERFIPIAEQSHLIDKIGCWALDIACQQGKHLMHLGYEGVRVAVNVSARQLNNIAFEDQVASALKDSGFPPNLLELEITETSLLQIDNSASLVQRLKNQGIQVSIDDFGTGFSSLSRLKNLPIDRIKIDRSFINGLPEDINDIEIVRAILALADALNLAVTAEGVETLEQAQFLSQQGAPDLQGYYFSQPLSARDLENWLQRYRPKPIIADQQQAL